MSGKRARSNRRLQKAAVEARSLAATLRQMADESRQYAGQGDETVAEDRDTAAWLNGLANKIYGGVDALPLPDVRDVERLARVAVWVSAQLDRSVRDVREQGASWQAIGYATGMTREGARKRWGSPPAD